MKYDISRKLIISFSILFFSYNYTSCQEISQVVYLNGNYLYASSGASSVNSSVVVCGAVKEIGSNMNDGLLMKMDSLGSLAFNFKHGGQKSDQYNHLLTTN